MRELGNSMTELLTESFCERCGTRYTFEASQRRRGGTSRLRVLSLGLRTFIANDDTSLSEAMAAARNDEERAVAARQMDAFHRTFNFCFSCRQYICANCWNDLAGTCLTCNPLEIDQFERSATLEATPPVAETAVPAAQPPAALDAALPAVDGSMAAGATGTDQAPQGAIAATGAAPLLRPRLEAVAWPRTDVAEPRTVEEPAEAPLAEGASADELTAAELQTVREALGAVPGADGAWPAAAELAAPEGAVEPTTAEQAVEPSSVEAAVELTAVEPTTAEATALPAAEAAPIPAEADQPETVAPPPASQPQPQPEASTLDGRRASAPDRPGRFGRLRTGGLLDRYRPAAGDKLLPTHPAPGAAGGAVPVDAAVAGDAPADERVAVDRAVPGESVADRDTAVLQPEPAPDRPTEPAPPADTEPAPPAAEPAPSRRPARAERPAATPVAAARDVVGQPVWSVVAPDTDEEPALPWTPGPRPAPRPLDLPPSAWAARLATARPDDVWAISAQDVVTTQAGAPAPSVQPCIQCGLALSANARFCRRCGAGQG